MQTGAGKGESSVTSTRAQNVTGNELGLHHLKKEETSSGNRQLLQE